MKIAIIGSGIAGNVVAHCLHPRHEIVLFEARSRPGGHARTHTIVHRGEHQEIDSGFIVYNEENYPQFTRLLAELRVQTQPSCMSFSVRDEQSGLEYSGRNLNTLFAQRRNLIDRKFWRMVREIMRFNARAPLVLSSHATEQPLGDYLRAEGYSQQFVRYYILPMGAAIWSTRPALMLDFPAQFFVRFLQNHGMLKAGRQLPWRSITGGSRQYVDRLIASFRTLIRLRSRVQWMRRTPGGVILGVEGAERERFDAAFVACHSDQALKLLADPTLAEREVLGAIPYQPNHAVLHTDTSLLPTRRRAWAAWNYHVTADAKGPVRLTYDMNELQGLSSTRRYLVTLNRSDAIDPRSILAEEYYDHPLFSPASTRAQQRHRSINGTGRTYYCGAWWGNGFHEDGVVSALRAVEHFEEDNAQRAVHRVG